MTRIVRMKTVGLLLLLGLVAGCSRAPLPTPTAGALVIPQESVVTVAAGAEVEESAEPEPPTPTATAMPTSEPTPEPKTTAVATEVVAAVGDSAETGDDFIEENDSAGAEISISQPITYVVQAGDALELIALEFEVDLLTLAETNNIAEFDQIEIGQELIIPVESAQAAPVEPESADLTEYTVEAGDALSLLAESFGISTAALAEANGLSVTDELFIGQVLVIPNP